MEHTQDMETPIADEGVRDDAHTAPQMSFGWTFESLPLAEAMRLARASRMDEGEYSMLREQLTRLAEDQSASVRITPPPAVSYQKARNHCLKVAKHLSVALTVRRAPGGQIVCWKATAQEMALREKRGAALQHRRAQKTSEKGTSSSRWAKRQRASTQTTLV
jgi:hypothetical protein